MSTASSPQKPSFTIRRAVPDDAAAACEVLRRSIRELCVADHHHDPAILEAWLQNKTAENVRAWFERATSFSVVAEVDDRIAGVARLDGARVVALCYVVPEVLHQGIGRALLQALEREARTRGTTVLELGSTQTARAFYARNGFHETGRNESMFGLVAIGMRKDLGRDAAESPP